MKKEIKALWLAALRDPKYKQTTSCLKDTKGFCCLGVLTDLFRTSPENTLRLDWVPSSPARVPQAFRFDSTGGQLPTVVQKWAGLDNSNPMLIHNKEVTPVSNLNDWQLNFLEIADIIEEQL